MKTLRALKLDGRVVLRNKYKVPIWCEKGVVDEVIRYKQVKFISFYRRMGAVLS